MEALWEALQSDTVRLWGDGLDSGTGHGINLPVAGEDRPGNGR